MSNVTLATIIESRTPAGAPAGSVELYAKAKSGAPPSDNMRMVPAGVMGLRSPTGEIVENVQLYELLPVEQCGRGDALSSGEIKACNEMVQHLAREFRKHIKKNT